MPGGGMTGHAAASAGDARRRGIFGLVAEGKLAAEDAAVLLRAGGAAASHGTGEPLMQFHPGRKGAPVIAPPVIAPPVMARPVRAKLL